MKKTVICVALLCLTPFLVFAAFHDSLAFLQETPGFAELMKNTWNRESPEVCEKTYNELQKSLGALDTPEKVYISARADAVYARYLVQGEKKNSKKAKKLVSDAYSKLDAYEKANPSKKGKSLTKFENCLRVLRSEIKSAEYLASPFLNLSKGMDSTKLIDASYKADPQEVVACVWYSNRRLYAPSYAGKNLEEAYGIFSELIKFPNLSDWDKFTVLSGLGMALKEKGLNNEAIARLNEAMAIYHGDPEIIKALKELKK